MSPLIVGLSGGNPHPTLNISTEEGTSFESNTIAVDAAYEAAAAATTPRSRHTQPPPPADLRRQRYRSLFVQRQAAASAVAASFDARQPSTMMTSTESSNGDGGCSSVIGVSTTFDFNSLDSDDVSTAGVCRRQQAPTQQYAQPPPPRFVARTASAALHATSNATHQLQQIHGVSSSGVRTTFDAKKKSAIGARSYDNSCRDFSVDSRSDSIFREFVRVDPNYDRRHYERGALAQRTIVTHRY